MEKNYEMERDMGKKALKRYRTMIQVPILGVKQELFPKLFAKLDFLSFNRMTPLQVQWQFLLIRAHVLVFQPFQLHLKLDEMTTVSFALPYMLTGDSTQQLRNRLSVCRRAC